MGGASRFGSRFIGDARHRVWLRGWCKMPCLPVKLMAATILQNQIVSQRLFLLECKLLVVDILRMP